MRSRRFLKVVRTDKIRYFSRPPTTTTQPGYQSPVARHFCHVGLVPRTPSRTARSPGSGRNIFFVVPFHGRFVLYDNSRIQGTIADLNFNKFEKVRQVPAGRNGSLRGYAKGGLGHRAMPDHCERVGIGTYGGSTGVLDASLTQ